MSLLTSISVSLFSRMKTLKDIVGEFVILAGNEYGWGVGDTVAKATANCRKATRRNPTRFGLMPKGSTVDGLSVTYPRDAKFCLTML